MSDFINSLISKFITVLGPYQGFHKGYKNLLSIILRLSYSIFKIKNFKTKI
jgi:hypothetical protein